MSFSAANPLLVFLMRDLGLSISGSGEMENYEGMISIESTTNEPMEIMFPKRGDSTEK